MLQTGTFELELGDPIAQLFEPDGQITNRAVASGELLAHLVQLRVEADRRITIGPASQPILYGFAHVRAST